MSVDIDNTIIIKRKRSAAKGKFHRIYGRLLEAIEEKIDSTVLNKVLEDLERAYQELEAKHETFLETFDSDIENEKTKVNELNHDMTLMYKELCKSRKLCQDMKKNANKTKKEHDSRGNTHEMLKVKRLDAPTFSGNIRDYPSFKVDYERHMVSSYGEDPYALKQCLSGEALNIVKGIDNDFVEMFRRLDLKYGRPERLVDNILSELKKLRKIPEGDNVKFISMVETVEKCWLDLKRMNLESEMNTVTIVSQIEKLLPPLQKREWALLKQRNESKSYSTGFQAFMKFLLDEKSALEYMDSDLREFVATKGKVHSAYGNYETEDSDTEKCNDIGIMMKENQNVMKQVVEGLAQVAQTVSKSDNVTNSSRTSQERTFRNIDRKKCWYHKSDNHDIGDCSIFARLDSQSKIDLLRKNGGCFSCLKTGHLSRQCHNRKPCEMLDESHQKCGKCTTRVCIPCTLMVFLSTTQPT